MKNKIIYWVTIIVSILYIVIGNRVAIKNFKISESGITQEYIKAEVINATEKETESNEEMIEDTSHITVEVEAKLLSGNQKGEVINCTQTINEINLDTTEKLSQGDKILVMYTDMYNNGEQTWTYVERLRSDGLIVLAIFFLALLIIFGRLKGVNTILSLGFTILSIFFVFIPAILSGGNIYFWAILTCIFL